MTFRDWQSYKRRQRVYSYIRAAKFFIKGLTRKLPWRKQVVIDFETRSAMPRWMYCDKPRVFSMKDGDQDTVMYESPAWTSGADVQRISRTGRVLDHSPVLHQLTPKTVDGAIIKAALRKHMRKT